MTIYKTNSEKIAKLIRTITIAPVMAFITMTCIYFFNPDIIGGLFPYLLSLFFLVILPISAYPLQRFIPYYKDKGRAGQRNFSILMSILGYILGFISSCIIKTLLFYKIIFLTYFLSAVLIAIFSKIIKFNVSGHSCGITGPLAVLVYVFNGYALLGLIILPIVFWASLKIKRHTFSQLIVGSLIPIAVFILLILIFNLI